MLFRGFATTFALGLGLLAMASQAQAGVTVTYGQVCAYTTGDKKPNTLYGQSGKIDFIVGQAGNDIIYAKPKRGRDDRLGSVTAGGAGNDTHYLGLGVSQVMFDGSRSGKGGHDKVSGYNFGEGDEFLTKGTIQIRQVQADLLIEFLDRAAVVSSILVKNAAAGGYLRFSAQDYHLCAGDQKPMSGALVAQGAKTAPIEVSVASDEIVTVDVDTGAISRAKK